MEDRRQFAAHLACCTECELDARVAQAVWRDSPDEARVEQRVRGHIAAARSKRRWIQAGALVGACALCLIAILLRPAPRLYADAARDHRMEVIENRPRHWKSGTAEIDTLTAKSGLSFAQAADLAPAGYTLERAKTCGLDGQPVLHLVFAQGVRKYSVYLRRDRTAEEGIRLVRRSSEQVASFETGRFRAVVVTGGAASECEQLARFTAARLRM